MPTEDSFYQAGVAPQRGLCSTNDAHQLAVSVGYRARQPIQDGDEAVQENEPPVRNTAGHHSAGQVSLAIGAQWAPGLRV